MKRTVIAYWPETVLSIDFSYYKPVTIEHFEYELRYSKNLVSDIRNQDLRRILKIGITVSVTMDYVNTQFF